MGEDNVCYYYTIFSKLTDLCKSLAENINQNTMKTFTAVLCLALITMTFGAALEKKNVIDDLTGAASNIAASLQKDTAQLLQCEGLLKQAPCEDCCAGATWTHQSEAPICSSACSILP